MCDLAQLNLCAFSHLESGNANSNFNRGVPKIHNKYVIESIPVLPGNRNHLKQFPTKEK